MATKAVCDYNHAPSVIPRIAKVAMGHPMTGSL